MQYIKVEESTKKIIEVSQEQIFPSEGYTIVSHNFNFEPSVEDAVWIYLGGHRFEYRYMKDGSDLPDHYIFYDIFILLLTNKNLIYNLQYKTTSDGYLLQFYDGNIPFYCKLNTIDHPTEITDFEANYKDGANKPLEMRSSEGATIFAPTLDDVQGLFPKKKMYKYTALANSINIFDELVNIEKRICGGEYWIFEDDINKVHEDDTLEFSIVDKNDILGLFSLYGLSVANGDVLELTKFVIDDYIKKGNKNDGYHSRLYEGIKGTNILYPGLFMRATIQNNSSEDYRFMWRCYFYQ